MTIYFINANERDTPAKISSFLLSVGYEGPEGYYGVPVHCIKIDSQSRTYGFLGAPVPPCKNLTNLEGFRGTFAPTPKPSYEWLEKQLDGRTKQLLALGYEDRGGEMMAPPIGKTPEYVLNDLSPEQAIQAFKDGKSVTVAGKPMTSGTTVEELLDSQPTLKHKRFGRIVLTDQVTTDPEVGAEVFYAYADGSSRKANFSAHMWGIGEGILHLTEQGAIDHAEEMARLNRDGFVEMDVEALTRIKDSLKETLTPLTPEDPPKPFGWTSRRVKDAVEEIEGMLKEFY